MKRIAINKNEVGMVIKNNAVKRILTEGTYWLGFGESVDRYNMADYFHVNHNTDVLLTVPGFAELVEIVDVLDNEICLVFINNLFTNVLGPGRYFFWKGLLTYNFQIENMNHWEVPDSINRAYMESPALMYYINRYIVRDYEGAILMVNGKFERELIPGEYNYWKSFNRIEVLKVDFRTVQMDIHGQEILTKDKVQIRLNLNIQYQVSDMKVALLENHSYIDQLYNLMQMEVRLMVGNQNLDQLLENKEVIAETILMKNVVGVNRLGLKLISAGIKDIILPGEVRDIMNQVLVAEKKAQANIITRREETASTRSLLNTAKLLEENAMLFRLKEMEYVEKIADKINSISVSGNGQIVDQLKQLFLNK